VLEEKNGEFVAHFKTTVAVLPRSTAVLAGDLELDETRYTGDHSLKEELKALVSSALWKKEDKKKK